MKSAVAVADLFTGMYASTAILAALRHAERTGEGQHIDLSLLDCQVAMLANLGANYLTSNQPPQRFGNAHANIAPYQVFPTLDGHIVIAVGNDRQFRAFCAEAGLTLADDDRFATNAGRTSNRIELADAIGVALTQRTTAHWIAVLERAKVPCGPINTLPQVFNDPHIASRRMIEDMTRTDSAGIRLVASPLKMDATPPQTRLPPPLLGQDTDAVLKELGLTADDIDRLRSAQII
jgi:crotonobetainyl-CoA:carnitine CoA-transferase CaiB-like acyl-CoA transferase